MSRRKEAEKFPSQRPMTRADLAWEYGVSPRTFQRRLAEAGILLPPGRILPADLRRVYRILGTRPLENKRT